MNAPIKYEISDLPIIPKLAYRGLFGSLALAGIATLVLNILNGFLPNLDPGNQVWFIPLLGVVWFPALVGLCCGYLSIITCHAQVIDDFSESPVALTRADTPVFLSQTSLPPSNVIGGSRDIVLGGAGSAGQFVDISDGSLTTGSTSDSLLYLSLTYGSDTSPLGLDLSLTGHDRFSFEDFTGAASGFFHISSPTGSAVVNLRRLSSERPFLLFSDFDGGVNFSDISTIEFDASRNSQTFGFSHPVLLRHLR